MAGFDQAIEPPGVGRVLGGRYRLVAPIARGGMAEVWEGHDEVLSRPVAVKVLQAHLAYDGVFLERFRREAVTAARLAHPGIVATFDTGLDDGTAFIVMELVRGQNLRQCLDAYGRLQPWQAVAVARQVADALAYAHQADLVHRDVKPANILLIDDDWSGVRVKVTDFGIAKAGERAGADLTRTGMVLGTPKYLSPEQIRGLEPDARADLYSLGVVLYEMLVGGPPYVGDTDMATALAHLGDKVPKPSASVRGLPGPLDRLVVDLLAKSPDRRVPSALEARRRLDALGPLAPPESERPGWAARAARPAGPPVATPHPNPPRDAPAPGAATTPAAVAEARVAAVAASAAPTTALPGGPPGDSPRDGASPGGPRRPPLGPGDPGATRLIGATSDRGTDEYDGLAPVPGPDRRDIERTVGWVVLGLVVIGAVVAMVALLAGSGHRPGRTAPHVSTPASGPSLSIVGVQEYLSVAGHQLDDPGRVPLVVDGSTATAWTTDQYTSPTFGNLYPGIGLEVELSAAARLHTLSVISPTLGWAGSAYVSDAPIQSGQPLSAWGPATSTTSGIAGNATFQLGGRTGRYVLLWITNLGPADMARIAELSVR